jgi:hypothetical protein
MSTPATQTETQSISQPKPALQQIFARFKAVLQRFKKSIPKVVLAELLETIEEVEAGIRRERVQIGVDRAAGNGTIGGRPRSANKLDDPTIYRKVRNGEPIAQIAREAGIARSTVRAIYQRFHGARVPPGRNVYVRNKTSYVRHAKGTALTTKQPAQFPLRAEYVRLLLKKAGRTWNDLEEFGGPSRHTMHKIRDGKFVYSSVLTKLADALGIKESDIPPQ